MKRPESIIQARFGDITEVEILGETVDLIEAVSIPEDIDIAVALAEHPERRALWARVVSEVKRRTERAKDDLEELRAVRFHQYWQTLEERERAEMVEQTFDEDEARDAFRRRKRVQARVSQGVKAVVGRWRRNFSDELVWSLVNSDDGIIAARKKLRVLKAQQEVAYGVLEALDQRMRCLSHLSALHRDDNLR